MICGRCATFRTAHVAFLFPHLQVCRSGPWARVTEAREAGDLEGAGRLARRAMGVKAPPMSEETKEQLKTYAVEHKDQIAFRAKVKRGKRRALKSALSARGKEIKRKR